MVGGGRGGQGNTSLQFLEKHIFRRQNLKGSCVSQFLILSGRLSQKVGA